MPDHLDLTARLCGRTLLAAEGALLTTAKVGCASCREAEKPSAAECGQVADA